MSDEDRDRGARYMAEIHRLREENERQAAELAEAKYLVLRGAPRQIDQLLTRALMALRQAIGSGNLEAERDGD